MTEKHPVVAILVTAIILSASTIVPTYLWAFTAKGMAETKADSNMENFSEDEISLKAAIQEHVPSFTIDSLFPNAKVEKTAMSIAVHGMEGNLDITRYNITAQDGTRYLKIEAGYKKIRIADEYVYEYKLETPPIPIENLEKTNGSMLKDAVSTTSDNPVRYSYDGNVTYISTQSSPRYVKYDHPDNGPYPNQTYPDIIPDETDPPTTLRGSSKLHAHMPKHDLDDAIMNSECNNRIIRQSKRALSFFD